MSFGALDPAGSWLRVWTRKAGLLARAAHDLCLESRAVQVEVSAAGAELVVRAVVPVDSLRVLGQVLAGGRVEPLRPADHQEIEANLRGPRVLDAARFPAARWEGRGPLPGGPGPWRPEGRLEVRGRAVPLALPVRLSAGPEGLLVEGEVELRQTALGIEPFSALLGALKVKDELRVGWSLRWPGGKL